VALVILAGHLGPAIEHLSRSAEQPAENTAPTEPLPPARGTRVPVRHFAADHRVFVDDAYLTKGVAGAIIW
jgi:hypothetical protein